MGRRLILGAVLLFTLLHMCCGTEDIHRNQVHRRGDLKSLSVSRREVAAQAQDDGNDRLHVVVRSKRDVTDTGQPEGAGFPMSDGLPPPGGPLPPLAPNDRPITAAPFILATTPSPTADNGSPPSRISSAFLVLCLLSCLFLRQTL